MRDFIKDFGGGLAGLGVAILFALLCFGMVKDQYDVPLTSKIYAMQTFSNMHDTTTTDTWQLKFDDSIVTVNQNTNHYTSTYKVIDGDTISFQTPDGITLTGNFIDDKTKDIPSSELTIKAVASGTATVFLELITPDQTISLDQEPY